MNATSSVRPGNEKRDTAQAAATPNTTLATSAIGTTVSVSRIAWRVSASATRFFQYTPTPSESAPTNTFAIGTTTSNPTVASATNVSVRRTQRGSSFARRTGAPGPCGAFFTGAD